MQRRLLAWLTVAVLGLLLAACGGPQTAQGPPSPEDQGEPAPAVGVFAEETIRDLLALAPDGVEAFKILRMPPEPMVFLEMFLRTVDLEPNFGGATLLDSMPPILVLLADMDSPGPAVHAMLWVRQPNVGLVVTPMEQSPPLEALVTLLITSAPEANREDVERFGQTWTRLTQSDRSPSSRSPMETLVRWHDDRFFLLVGPEPHAPSRETRLEALTERLEASAFNDARTERILEHFSALHDALDETIETDEGAEQAVRRWAAGTPGGRLDPALASALQTLLTADRPEMEAWSSVSAALPDAARFVSLLRAHQNADLVLRDTMNLSMASDRLLDTVQRTLRCLERQDPGRPWLAFRYNAQGVRTHVRLARERPTEDNLVSLLDLALPDPSSAQLALMGTTAATLRQERSAHSPFGLHCEALLGDPLGLVYIHHAPADIFRIARLCGEPELAFSPPWASRRPLAPPLIDAILQNGTVEVEADTGALVIQLLAPPPLQHHLDAHAEGIPGIEVARGSDEASGTLRYRSMTLTWRPVDAPPTGPEREGPLHLWTLQFAAPGDQPRESISEPVPQWTQDTRHSSLFMGSLLHPAELVDAITLPLIESGLTSHVMWTAAPILDALLEHGHSLITSLETGTEEGVFVAVEETGFPHIARQGEQASEWGTLLAEHGELEGLTDPFILGPLLLLFLPPRVLRPDDAPEGLRFLPTNHHSPGNGSHWHTLMLHADDHGAFAFLLDDRDPEHRDAADTRPPPRWTLDVHQPVVLETLGRPLVMALHTPDGTPIGTPFTLASAHRIPRVEGSVLDLVFSGLGGGTYGAHLLADAPMELHLVCVEGCDHPVTLELVFE